MDKLLWSLPPPPPPSSSSASAVDDNNSATFEFEFSDQSLPDTYRLSADTAAAATVVSDDWVLFADVSTALSVETVDALTKLLDNDNAVMAVPADRFHERVVPRNILGRRPMVVLPVAAAVKKSSSVVVAEQSPVVNNNINGDDDDDDSAAVAATTDAGEQIHLVRYDRKLKQLLGVDAYTSS